MKTNDFSVGFARVCITPEESVPLGGYGNVMTRMSQNVLSDIFSICLCLSDGEETVLLFENDLIASGEEITVPIRRAVSEKTGLPVSHILIGATHSHSAPDYRVSGVPCVERYKEFLKEKMLVCAEAALADRKPAEMFFAFGKTKNLNFVRHYVTESGGYKGDNFGDLDHSPYVCHTTEADPSMRIVKFAREGGKDVLLVNWQCHPHRTGGSRKYDVSADIIGVLRDELSEKTGSEVIYFTGGAGNLNPTSRIKEENLYQNYLESGHALAMHALDALKNTVPAKTGKLRVLEKLHQEPLNRPGEEKLRQAEEIDAIWKRTNDYMGIIEKCNACGINSPYAASSLLGKHRMPFDRLNVPMYAVSFGDAAFVTAPYEMFDTSAKYIRDFSPFPMTVVASCANDDNTYVPSAYACFHGCYETDATLFRPGTAEVFAQMYVKMLEALRAQEPEESL